MSRLAAQKRTTRQAAVKSAVQAKLDRIGQEVPLVELLEKFLAENPMPPATGKISDKAFFHWLSENS